MPRERAEHSIGTAKPEPRPWVGGWVRGTSGPGEAAAHVVVLLHSSTVGTNEAGEQAQESNPGNYVLLGRPRVGLGLPEVPVTSQYGLGGTPGICSVCAPLSLLSLTGTNRVYLN